MRRQTSLVRQARDHAWIIELKGEPHECVAAGVFNWLTKLPPCLSGATTAIFATRAEARAARATMFAYGPRRAVVRKVGLTLEVLEEGGES